jgi:hypothetical protein
MKTITIMFEPLTIEVGAKREEIFLRVEAALAVAEDIMKTAAELKFKLRAMEIIGQLARVLAGFLEDVQLEAIEADLEELKREASKKT